MFDRHVLALAVVVVVVIIGISKGKIVKMKEWKKIELYESRPARMRCGGREQT